MNVWVRTIDGHQHNWDDVDVSFDTDVLQVAYKSTTTTFPLSNVIAFSTSSWTPESGHPS